MKDYLKMADVFDVAVEPKQLSGWKHRGRYIELKKIQEAAVHAINSHDELVQINKELLAALIGAKSLLEHYGKVCAHSMIDYQEFCIAELVIEKHEGGAA